MEKQIAEFTQPNKKQELPVIKSGDTVKVYQKYKDKGKDKIQMFEGLVICRKHGNETGATITVRKIASGVGVEKLFPLFSEDKGRKTKELYAMLGAVLKAVKVVEPKSLYGPIEERFGRLADKNYAAMEKAYQECRIKE